MGYEYDSKVNRDLARTAMSIYTKSQGIKPQEINESKQNLNEEFIRENVNGLIMNYISDVIILAEAQMGREMSDIEISEASDELLRRIDSISDTDKLAFINELSEAATMTSGGTTAIGSQAGKGNVMTTGGGAPVAVSGRPTGGGFNVANFSPANYATAQDALDAMFAAGYTNGQDIAMVLGQNWSAGMSQG